MQDKREIFIKRLKEDLIGPLKEDELLSFNPETTYLNGILYPSNECEPDEYDDETDPITRNEDTHDETKDRVSNNKIRKPSSMGLSFCIDHQKNKNLELEIKIDLGIYAQEINDNSEDDKKIKWRRKQINHKQTINLIKKNEFIEIKNQNLNNLFIWYEKKEQNNLSHITLAIVNQNKWTPRSRGGSDTKKDQTERSFFQTNFELFCKFGFEPRPITDYEADDEDEKIYELIYRNNKDYCSGFNCTSNWEQKNNEVKLISATWLTEKRIYSVSTEGDKDFFQNAESLTAKSFKQDDINEINKKLTSLIEGYQNWINSERDKINELNDHLNEQGKINLSRCEIALDRMKSGLNKLCSDENVLEAFRFANSAIEKQYSWNNKSNFQFSWRPFQLGFFLLNLNSIIDENSEERDYFDLLWFPTGGGKTEAYLFISVFLIFYSRLNKKFENTKGTQIIMRYTLRALTIDQFSRIASTICAAEILRKENSNLFGDKEITLGLWVGQKQTPNWYSEAAKVINNPNSQAESTPRQLINCPCCKNQLLYTAQDDEKKINVECVSPESKNTCEIQKKLNSLPILTVDECLYNNLPTFLLATIDKFAQIIRKDEALGFLGKKGFSSPPSLIIQDELHLITGPLGTLTALYETAIDSICTSESRKIKIIGSTATIKSASNQVKNLFNRKSFQFPPPGIDYQNSFFSKIDTSSHRKYVALSSNGRSDKYLLQMVSTSLLQSGMDNEINKENFINNYGTVVAYFNSLKILSSSEPMMNEQVRDTIQILANRRKEKARLEKLSPPEELSGRKKSSEIPIIRERLISKDFGKPGFIDIVLATNMISVGIDIRRLNLMIVNGQPKSMSEYIQATSRVGRDKNSGIIVSLYNHSKIRDRNRYENFSFWHNEIYKGVENTSVTPFSPNSRDKALHVLLFILCKIKLNLKNVKDIKNKSEEAKNEIIPIILNKIENVDPSELDDSKKELESFLDLWIQRSNTKELKYFWNQERPNESLLISFESFVAKKASGSYTPDAKPTPNSLRGVEPGVEYSCKEGVVNLNDQKE